MGRRAWPRCRAWARRGSSPCCGDGRPMRRGRTSSTDLAARPGGRPCRAARSRRRSPRPWSTAAGAVDVAALWQRYRRRRASVSLRSARRRIQRRWPTTSSRPPPCSSAATRRSSPAPGWRSSAPAPPPATASTSRTSSASSWRPPASRSCPAWRSASTALRTPARSASGTTRADRRGRQRSRCHLPEAACRAVARDRASRGGAQRSAARRAARAMAVPRPQPAHRGAGRHRGGGRVPRAGRLDAHRQRGGTARSRPVFAVPGPVRSAASCGTNRLLARRRARRLRRERRPARPRPVGGIATRSSMTRGHRRRATTDWSSTRSAGSRPRSTSSPPAPNCALGDLSLALVRLRRSGLGRRTRRVVRAGGADPSDAHGLRVDRRHYRGRMPWAIDEFAASLTAVAPATVVAYRRDVRCVRRPGRSAAGIAGPEAVERITLRRYLASLTTKRRSKRTIARAAASLRRYFGWLHRTGVIASDPTTGLSAPRGEPRLPHVLRGRRAPRAARRSVRRESTTIPSRSGVRDDAVLELLYGSGLRVSELCGLGRATSTRRDGGRRCGARARSSARCRSAPPAAAKVKRWLDDGRERVPGGRAQWWRRARRDAMRCS